MWCANGLTCVGSVCVAQGIANNCATATCATSADCGVALTCGANFKCGIGGVSVGAACGTFIWCASGLTCSTSTNKCEAIAVGGSCTATNQPYDPTGAAPTTPTSVVATLDGGCVNTAYCSGGTCTARIALTMTCTTDVSCVVGAVCNAGKCTTKGSLGATDACDRDWACPTTQFCSNAGNTVNLGFCQNKVADGSRCSPSCSSGSPATCTVDQSSPQNRWCTSGFCSANDGVRPVCRTPNLAPGAVCYNNDECGAESSWGCLNAGAGTAGVCSGNTNGNTCLGTNNAMNYSACGNHSPNNYGCSCTKAAPTAPTCQGPPAATCTTQSNAVLTAAFATGYYCVGQGQVSGALCASLAGGPYGGQYSSLIALAMANGNQDPSTAALFCCMGCNAGAVAFTAGQINQYAGALGRALDCSANTVGSLFTGTTLTNLCRGTAGQNVALAASAFLGVCKAPSAGVAIVPSLSFVFAFVAACLALFL
jgi:hypothetical protein